MRFSRTSDLMRSLPSDGGSAGTREMENGAYGALPCPPSRLGSHPNGPLTLLQFTSPLIIKNLKNLLSAAAPLSLVCWGAGVGSHKVRDAGCKNPSHQPLLHNSRNWCFEAHSPRSLEPDISDHGESWKFWEVKIPIPKGHQDSTCLP